MTEKDLIKKLEAEYEELKDYQNKRLHGIQWAKWKFIVNIDLFNLFGWKYGQLITKYNLPVYPTYQKSFYKGFYKSKKSANFFVSAKRIDKHKFKRNRQLFSLLKVKHLLESY